MPTSYSTTCSGTLECAQQLRRLVVLCLVFLFHDFDSTKLLKIVSLCNVCLCTNAFFLSAICICWSAHCPMTGWVCQWKPFGIPVYYSFKRACVEDCVFQITHPSDISLPGGQGVVIPETPKVSLPVSSSQREAPKPEVSTCAQERIEAPLPPLQPRSTCDRLELPFSCDAIYCQATMIFSFQVLNSLPCGAK